VTWVAWRQQRVLFVSFAVATALLILWVVTSGVHEHALWHQYHQWPCHNGVGILRKNAAFCTSLYHQVAGSQSHDFWISDFAQVLAPSLGAVLGVSAIAGELERKTARLAWTQSLTRTRWLVTKTLVGLGEIVVLVVPLCVTLTWWVGVSRLGPRVAQTAYPLAGWLLGVYAVFTFVLVVFLGVLIRRSGPTIAALLLVIIGCSLLISQEVRTHLVPLNVATTTFQTVTKGDFTTGVTKGGAPANSWIIFSGFIPLDSNSAPASWAVESRIDNRVNRCENPSGSNSGESTNVCLRRLGLRNVQIYISDHEFWQLQLREGALYLIAGLLLFGTTVVVIRRIRV
jgi:hypothetical protein